MLRFLILGIIQEGVPMALCFPFWKEKNNKLPGPLIMLQLPEAVYLTNYNWKLRAHLNKTQFCYDQRSMC